MFNHSLFLHMLLGTNVAYVAGVVVGKKGSMILNIQQETKTKLLEARKPITSSLWSPIMIHGEPCAVYAAYSAISSLVDSK